MTSTRPSLAVTVAVLFVLLAGALGWVLAGGFKPASDKVPPTSSRIEISSISYDSFVEIEWDGYPVVVYRPGPKFAASLPELNRFSEGKPLDAKALPSVFVYRRVSTHLGCGLVKIEKGDPRRPDWPGGWVDPCHIGEWDYAGRLLVFHPGTIRLPSLTVPKFRFVENNKFLELM